MMSATDNRPAILPPTPANIPLALRAAKRWAPWRAVWNAKKQKYEKIPHRAARPVHGLSNKGPAGWASFDEAMACFEENVNGAPIYDRGGERIVFAGVGYLMTGPHGVTGVDLDRCRDPITGDIAEWAQEVIAKLDTYTEVSPSGTGLHAMSAADVSTDWTNHDRGIEVYGGNEARFLCVTGHQVGGSPAAMRPPRRGVMESLETSYRKARTKAEVEDLHLPDLIPAELLPDMAELDLPPHAANFLFEGVEAGDRSNALFGAAVALAQAGLARDEVLSVLEANEFAMEVALDHRRQDYDKALRYLWKEHAQAGSAKAEMIDKENRDVFDELEPAAVDLVPAQDEPTGTALDDFDALDDTEAGPTAAPVKRARFAPMAADQFLLRKPMQWLVRDVLPKAGLAVIYGASASGKTFLTLDLGAAISRGVEWRGKRVVEGRGVYIVAEGAEGFRSRVQAYCEFHGVDPASFAMGVIPDAPNLMDKAQVKELIDALRAFGPVQYVVVDTYARVMVGGNENDAKDAGLMVAHCARIHKATGAIVILVHHSGKDESRGARGSGALRAAADVEIEVLRTREYRAARIAKMKDGDDQGEYRFALDTVTLGENEDGDPITSCVIRHIDGGGVQDDRPAPKGHVEKSVMATITGLVDLGGDPFYNTAVESCVAQLPLEDGKRDRRRELVIRAIDKLGSTGQLLLGGGLVGLA